MLQWAIFSREINFTKKKEFFLRVINFLGNFSSTKYFITTYQDDVLDRLDLLDPLAVFPLDSCNFETDVVTGLFLALSIDVGWDVLDQSLHNCCWEYWKYSEMIIILPSYTYTYKCFQMIIKNIFDWKNICILFHIRYFFFC